VCLKPSEKADVKDKTNTFTTSCHFREMQLLRHILCLSSSYSSIVLFCLYLKTARRYLTVFLPCFTWQYHSSIVLVLSQSPRPILNTEYQVLTHLYHVIKCMVSRYTSRSTLFGQVICRVSLYTTKTTIVNAILKGANSTLWEFYENIYLLQVHSFTNSNHKTCPGLVRDVFKMHFERMKIRSTQITS
jgi:hypothetical protein